jgi:hypothetical protein
MKKVSLIPKIALVAMLVTSAVSVPTPSQADGPASGGGCPRNGDCPDVWSPVICSNGAVYGNSCYAYLACATDCVPYGDPTM